MFAQLVESNRTVKRSASGALASIALHTALISLAVAATASARVDRDAPIVDQFLVYVRQKSEAAPVARPSAPVKQQPVTPVTSTPMVAPVSVPTALPAISTAPAVSEIAPVTGTEAASGPVGTGLPGETTVSGPLTEFEVDKAVRAFRTNRPPTYPDILRSQGVEGEVLARYVVDANGHVDMKTFEVVSASSPVFTNAVRYALERARFEPAEAAGRKVAQLVEQRFQFRLN